MLLMTNKKKYIIHINNIKFKKNKEIQYNSLISSAGLLKYLYFDNLK